MDTSPSEDREPREADEPERPGLARAGKALRTAKLQFQELTGKVADSVTALDRTDGGWRFVFETVELERVPATTSVLGSYETETDAEGNVVTYTRLRRYSRNRTDDSGARSCTGSPSGSDPDDEPPRGASEEKDPDSS